MRYLNVLEVHLVASSRELGGPFQLLSRAFRNKWEEDAIRYKIITIVGGLL